MKLDDLKKMDGKNLKAELKKALKDLYAIRLKVLTFEEKNHSKLKKQKKLVARIKTLLNLK